MTKNSRTLASASGTILRALSNSCTTGGKGPCPTGTALTSGTMKSSRRSRITSQDLKPILFNLLLLLDMGLLRQRSLHGSLNGLCHADLTLKSSAPLILKHNLILKLGES